VDDWLDNLFTRIMDALMAFPSPLPLLALWLRLEPG